MLRAVIIDDEQPALDMLKILLAYTEQVAVVGEYTKPSEFMRNIGKLQPDVVFLDIEMPGVNGIELAEYIVDQAAGIDIVFTTAFREYAVDAFTVNAVDYLLKPVLQENVDRAVARLAKRRNRQPEAMETNANTQIRCFGKLEVRNSSGRSPVKWRTVKVEELFAYLLYHRGSVVQKAKILDSLWPGCEPETADNNLHTTVYRLKKALKENDLDISIRFAGGGYIMELANDVYCDVDIFTNFIAKAKAVTKGDLAGFEEVAALYQGDYLDGKDYLWCFAERARLQKDYSDIAKQMARCYLALKEYQKAEKILQRNIEYLPYDEEAYEMILRVCFLRQDRVSIIKYYNQLKTILQTDLGIAPKPSLKRLYDSLMYETRR